MRVEVFGSGDDVIAVVTSGSAAIWGPGVDGAHAGVVGSHATCGFIISRIYLRMRNEHVMYTHSQKNNPSPHTLNLSYPIFP